MPDRHSIKTHLVLSTTALIVVIVSLLTGFTTWNSIEILKKNASRELSRAVKQSAGNLSSFIALRQSNLDLWATQPLVEVFFNNPQLAALSTPGLRTYFARIRARENWIESILLIDNGQIAYDDTNILKSIKSSAAYERLHELLENPDLTGFTFEFPSSPAKKQIVLFIKHALVKNGRPEAGKYFVIAIAPHRMQQVLFNDIRVGKNGFIALLAKSDNGIWVPPFTENQAAKKYFLESSRNWHKWSDIPKSYKSDILKAQTFPALPLAVVGVASRGDIFDNVSVLIRTSVLAGVFVLFIGIGLSLLSSMKIARPLAKLMKNVQQIEMDNLEQFKATPQKTPYTEVKILNDAFSAMIEKLISSRMALTDKNAQLLKMHRSLRLQRNHLYTTLSSIGDGVITTDKATVITFLNPVAERILGCETGAVIGKPLHSVFHIINEQTRMPVENPVEKVIQFGKVVGLANHTILIDQQGREIPIDDCGAPIQDDEGNLYGVVLVFRDISKRHRLEKQLRQAQKLESIGRLAGGVAHDFNNMLSVIIGYAELALDKVGRAEPLHADIEEILTAAKRSTTITRQLLAFARQQAIAPKILDLNVTVKSMLNMLQRLIGEDIDLAWRPQETLWPVKIDPAQVDQILANLCVNARDAITDVGKITIETGTKTFDAAYCAEHTGFNPGDFVMLAVSDDGCGMVPETLDKIFEPFFTTKDAGRGTGLGLATIYGIVKQNEGFINVYSEPGKGTTFRIYLSRHAGEVIEAPPLPLIEIPRGNGERVLVVEDETSTLRMIERMLSDLNYHVFLSNTPAEALRMATEDSGEISLLISDLILPEMNGRDLAEQLSVFYPRLRCLFMSGYTADVIAHRGMLEEGVNFIQKPFSKNDLAVKVRAAIELT